MSGLKNFKRIEKKHYSYKICQILLDDEEESLFEYEEIRPKKTPKPKRSYDEVFTAAIKEYAKTFISQIETSTLNSNMKTNSKKQVVIKNIGNMAQLHTNKAMDYIAKDGELVRDEFFRWIDYGIIANDWNADFTELRSKNPRLKNMAMHLVFSLDENLHPSNLAILELSVHNSLIDVLRYDYPFMIKLHTHQNKPHAHVIINKTHKFTGKQLRFANKQHVREFFFQLRESFQDQLYIHSHGRLNYSNEPNIQKRIAGINEELSKLISQGQEQFKQNFNHNEFFDKAYDDAHREMKLLASVKSKELDKLDFIKNKIITSKAIELLEENFEIDDEHMVWLEKFLKEKSTKPDLKELGILKKGTYKKVKENNYHIKNFDKALKNKKTSLLERQRLNALKQKALAFNEFFKELQNFYNSVKKIHTLEQKINALDKACSNYINIGPQ
ncbi:relaxase/mobilization nuclease domain-containing protein [Helicobacter pylori]|uniref:relaxase/mobilization nuclease domain-containing protein n=1 Tax=Helicobacter pylori TaxID=210 RepID=UPI0003FF622A|nr:relaxase [Helicobacter pylori]